MMGAATLARRARRGLLVAAAATLAGACNALTGASNYTSVAACTGSLCAAECAAQGGDWYLTYEGTANTCVCPNGGPLCGGSSGVCCGGTAPFCVTESSGAQRCSACTEASYECGTVCCEQQTCLNASNGACGVPYGVPRQSCKGGLLCPVPLLDGTTQAADCCESIDLPGGTFEMGLSLQGKNECPAPEDLPPAEQCPDDEVPQHSVTLSPYALDRFEVTVGRFRSFVEAFDLGTGLPTGAGGDAAVAGSGWPSGLNASLPTRGELEQYLGYSSSSTWTAEVGANENRPITGVNWIVAFAFCVWDGGRLPTEAEWEFAAANGSSGDLYPWGEATPTPELAVYDCSADAVPCASPPALPADVGSVPMGANRWGHLDLAGNVDEWTLDTWGPYPSEPTTNFANVTYGFRVLRGGSFADSAQVPAMALAFDWPLRAAARNTDDPQDYSAYLGIRCARAP